ncbi:MAG: biotin--[acetyl-CoA-carboxylase] ligase [Pirellulales bacterium]|nr:biotin--[acetyl-CoA-carboxylase] ligase [Pirellulales bacterium]
MIDVVRILRETFVARAEHHPALDSTNDRAIQCAASGVKDLPLLIVADEQTAGRGRGSNRWWTGRGGLAMSLLIDAETAAAEGARSPLVALAAAVAAADSVASLLPNDTIGIHWPNDVMARTKENNRKLAGVLIEVLADRRHVVGLGLNLNNTLADAPAELQSVAATVRDLSGKTCDPTDVLVDLLKRLERAFSELRRTPADVAARADALCLQRGRSLSIKRGDRIAAGRCRGIAPDGGLILDSPAGAEKFFSGIVVGQS